MKNNLLSNKKNSWPKTPALTVIICLFSLFCTLGNIEIYLPSNNISDSVVRLHIVANSDTVFDQSVKLKVRDAVIEKYGKELSSLASRNDALNYLECHSDEIGEFAGKVLASFGCGYEARAFCGQDEFPDKNYGIFTFGKGEYTALNITLGSGSGQNWWCVLYPPLCFLNVRTEEGYDAKKDVKGKVKVKSAIWEWVKGENNK